MLAGAGSEGVRSGPLRFLERAPGYFEARFPVRPSHEVRLVAGAGSQVAVRLVSDAHADVAPERQVDPRMALDLQALARATAGEHASLFDAAELPLTTGGAHAPVEVRPLWPWLLLVALLLYLCELAWRRRPRRLAREATL